VAVRAVYGTSLLQGNQAKEVVVATSDIGKQLEYALGYSGRVGEPGLRQRRRDQD